MEPSETSPHGNLPARFRLNISVAAGSARDFELFRSGMSPLYAVDAESTRARPSFRATMTSYQFADVAIAEGQASAARYERTNQTIARSGLDNIGLMVYSGGGGRLDAEGNTGEIHPGDVCILDMTRPHSVRAPDFANLSVVLPRRLLAPHLADPDRLHGLILKSGGPLNTMLVSHLQMWFAQAPALLASDGRAAAQGAVALIAAYAGASAAGREEIRKASVAASLQSARRVVEANLHDRNFGPETICRQLGMSRSKLYRLFEPAGGVGHYILMRRMRRAYHCIIDPALAHERIGSIAAQCGFGNASVFSRAFRQAYGISPTDLRDAFARADVADNAPSFDNDFAAMKRWLQGSNSAA